MRTTLLIATYNWPQALRLVLRSVASQSRLPDEVIVADDGSGVTTRQLLEAVARDFPCRLVHLWQEDRGFRVARARNRGIMASRADYLISLDGDMILHPHFVADHLASAQPREFLVGGRLRATARESARLLAGGPARHHPLMDGEFNVKYELRRRHALRLPWLARIARRGRPRVMSCNMSFWREDLLRVNGFDERMEGYGSEDLELAARLVNAGVACRPLKYAALAVHLDHATRAPTDPNDTAMPNNRILLETRRDGHAHTAFGMDRHADEFAQAPADLRRSSAAT